MPRTRTLKAPLQRDDLAWAAGFFDGEGGTYVSWARKRKPDATVSALAK